MIDRIPERTETLREQLARALRDAVLSGRIKPGERIVENQLAARLGVSRGPLREAIFQLVEEGLFEQVPYRGTVVKGLDAQDLAEIYSFRIMLETFAFEIVWDRRDRAFRDELVRRHDALLAAVSARDAQAAITTELDLHGLVYEASGHRILQATWQMLRQRLHVYFSLHQAAHNRVGPLLDAHTDYVGRACGDDLGAMKDEIGRHMRRGLDRLEEFVRS